MTPATAGDPIASASIEAPRAVRPITKPKIWPLLISASAACKAANSISCWCFASDSAITKIRSAAPWTSRSYPSRTEGGGMGPENVDCWNCATGSPFPPVPGVATAPLAVLTAFLGGFCFCCWGRTIIGKRTAGAANRLANASEMASHSFSSGAMWHHLPQAAYRGQIHHAPCAAKKTFCFGIHSLRMLTGSGLTIKLLGVAAVKQHLPCGMRPNPEGCWHSSDSPVSTGGRRRRAGQSITEVDRPHNGAQPRGDAAGRAAFRCLYFLPR